jgi:phthiodiolone/phenolphthiodiolone dimycocerosates ketoreductase
MLAQEGEKDMVASKMTVGIDLLPTPPLALNRVLIYFARLSRLDCVWAVDHWQGPIPTAIWDRKLSWAATPTVGPHELFDYQVLLGSLASRVGRLRIGVGVTEPIRRHPVLIAQAMLTLAFITKRRPILGIGAGERMNIEPYGLDFSAPVGRLEEALQIIRLCFSHQGPIDFHGKHYQLEHAVMDLRAPKGKTPEIWIGGQGPRLLRLTGQYGDGWYPTKIASPQEYAAKLQIIRDAAQEAGRDPQAITPALVQNFVVAPSEQETRKMLDAKFSRLYALQLSAETWRKVGAPHPFGEHFRGYVDWVPEQYERKTLEEALAAVPPELIGYGLLYGTPEQVVGKLRAYGEVGVRHVVLVPVSAIFSRRASIYGLWAIRKIARWLRNVV